jgi:hypothetical protein
MKNENSVWKRVRQSSILLKYKTVTTKYSSIKHANPQKE